MNGNKYQRQSFAILGKFGVKGERAKEILRAFGGAESLTELDETAWRSLTIIIASNETRFLLREMPTATANDLEQLIERVAIVTESGIAEGRAFQIALDGVVGNG